MNAARPSPSVAGTIAVVHDDYEALMTLTATFGGMHYSVTSAQSKGTLDTARRLARTEPAAMIVSLRGKENLVEIRELLATAPGTRFVFLVPALPPRAQLARVVGEHGSTILWKDEARVVIVSTLVALLAGLGYRDEERATG